ncbi:hypothetical protein FXB40_02090 [Bradyrhizobium rifense]|uniref:Uncharacterized protein n=2 Tax=Bradyrhizobium rifense TaxID=515499 RepID=A0A5D3KSJ0_9BRAD|nr:hypothetical protein FXB40_02090 [Bradyrhizobium rifense]
MSAGIGISHSEQKRDSDLLKIFRIWLLPRRKGGAPRCESRKFPKADRAGRLITEVTREPN